MPPVSVTYRRPPSGVHVMDSAPAKLAGDS